MSLAVAATILILLTPTAAWAADAPRLVLSADAWHVVDPYRYDEARRFERGWNRGADAIPTGGVVRSVTGGTVRFAGLIAGRRVVTVATRIDDVDVVVTYTGLDAVDVREGDPVATNARLGRGVRVHVGAYDAGRRSRYFPVTAGVGGAPRGGDGLSGAITDRLRDAIDGNAAAATVDPAEVASAAPVIPAEPQETVVGASRRVLPMVPAPTASATASVTSLDRAASTEPGLASAAVRLGLLASAAFEARSRTVTRRPGGGTTSNGLRGSDRTDGRGTGGARTAVEAREAATEPPSGSAVVSRGAARTDAPGARAPGARASVAASGTGAGDDERRGIGTGVATDTAHPAALGARLDGANPREDTGRSSGIGGGPREPSGASSAGQPGSGRVPSAAVPPPQQPQTRLDVRPIGPGAAPVTASTDERPAERDEWALLGGPLMALALLALLAVRRRRRRGGGSGAVVHRIPPPMVPSPRRHGRVVPPMPPEERCESHGPIPGGVGLPDIDQPHEHPVRRRPREPA